MRSPDPHPKPTEHLHRTELAALLAWHGIAIALSRSVHRDRAVGRHVTSCLVWCGSGHVWCSAASGVGVVYSTTVPTAPSTYPRAFRYGR